MQDYLQTLINQFTTPTVRELILSVIVALVVLVVGWLVALLLAWLTRRLLRATSLDNRLAERMGVEEGKKVSIEEIVGKVVYYLVLLFVLVAVFSVLRLVVVATSLNVILENIMAFIPKLLGAGLLALLAWGVATFLRFVIVKGLGLLKFDDKMADQVGLTEEGRPPLGNTLGTIVYWFVWLLFLPAILDVLELQGLLQPIQAMIGVILVYLPKIFAAGIIILVGWAVAQIVRKITVHFLAAVGTDTLGERIGLKRDDVGGRSLSDIIGLVVYILIIIPVVIAGLQALDIEAISVPATRMLNIVFEAIPAIFGALLILGVSYLIARLLGNLVAALLTSIGFNKVLSMIGLGGEPDADAKWTPSELIGYLVVVAVMLFAAVEAANILGFEMLAGLVAQFVSFFWQVVLALIIMWLGLFAANLVYRVVMSTAGKNAHLLAQAARVVIIIFAGAIALFQIGIAEDIVNLAFGITLAAVAVAFALAFGLGARETAGEAVEGWLAKLRSGGQE